MTWGSDLDRVGRFEKVVCCVYDIGAGRVGLG